MDCQEEIINFGGGLVSLQATEHITGARAAGAVMRATFTGFLGDILTGQAFDNTPTGARHLMLNKHSSWLNANPDLRPDRSLIEAKGEIDQRLLDKMAKYADLGAGRAGMVVNLTHRQAHYIGGQFEIMHQFVTIATPFFHRPLMSFLLRLPTDQLERQRLYRQTLRHLSHLSADRKRGTLGVLAAMMDRWGRPYATYNRKALLRRSRRGLRRTLAPYKDDQLGRLALESLRTESELPLAYTAVPLLVIAHRAGLTEASDHRAG